MDEENKKSAPLNACIFERGCEVKFADPDNKDDNRFSIIAYSGQIISNHWWWGNVAFDLEGIKFAKAKTPVLQEHFSAARIGFSTKQDISDKVTLEGKFLSNATAAELRGDMAEGFPMQASVYLPPEVIEQVKEGETVEVNGHKLKGPGAVFRKGKILEVSMCTLGADSHTQSKAVAKGGKEQVEFNIFRKEEIMAEPKTKDKMTAEGFAAEHPDIFNQVQAAARAEGEKEVRELFWQFNEQFGDDPAFCIEQFDKGASLAEAVRAENVKLKAAAAEKASQTQTETGETVDLAEQEFSDEQQPPVKGEDGKPDNFDAAVEARMKKTKCSKAEAVRFVVKEQPKLHEKYLRELREKS